MRGKWTRLVRPTIQFFLVAFALFVGYTRVSDFKHHWSDVLVGLLQGALIAVLTVSPTLACTFSSPPTCVTTLTPRSCFRRSDTCPTSSSRGPPAARAPTRRRTNSWSANRTRSRPTPSAGTTTATPEPSEPGRHRAERTCDPCGGAGWGSGPDSALFSMIFPNLSAGERSENVI